MIASMTREKIVLWAVPRCCQCIPVAAAAAAGPKLSATLLRSRPTPAHCSGSVNTRVLFSLSEHFSLLDIFLSNEEVDAEEEMVVEEE